MPNRIIREGILSSERVDAIAGNPACEVFYRRLFSVVDDFGRFSGDARIIRAALYPLRIDSVSETQIHEHISACEAAGLLRSYTVGSKTYVELLDFRQRLRNMFSRYPAPSIDGRATVKRRSIDRKSPPETESESESETETETETESNRSRNNFRYDVGFDELWQAYPAKGRKYQRQANDAYIAELQVALDRDALHVEMMAAVKGKFAASRIWADGFVVALPKWIEQRCWLESPEPAVTERPDIPNW